jgi:hypothetical protein
MGNYGGLPPQGYGPPGGYGSPPGPPLPQQGYVVPCQACGNPVSPAAYQCQRCGHPVPRLPMPAAKSSVGPLIALVVIGVVVIVLGAAGYAIYASYTPVCGNYGEPPCPGATPTIDPPTPVATTAEPTATAPTDPTRRGPSGPSHPNECDPNAAMVHSGACAEGRCCHAAAPRSACVGAGGSFPLTPGGLCEVPWLACNAPGTCAD